MNRTSLLLIFLCCLTWFTGVARAQLPAARLTTVFPPGGQRGTDVEVTVVGIDLDDLKSLHFSNPSLVAKPKKDPTTGAVVPNVFVVRIGKDVSPGAYDVRAVGRYGVTNPRAFVVDREPHGTPKAGNTTPEAASDLAMNAGVYGQAIPAGSQYFRVNLKANHRVFVEVDGAKIDSQLDPVIVLFDAAGRELARDGTGNAIDFTPASDGAYVVQLFDVLYRGGPEYFFRLRVRDGARVEFATPAAIRPDEINELTIFGRNLPGGMPPAEGQKFERLTLRIPGADDADDAAELRTRWLVPPVAGMLDGELRYNFAGAVNPTFLARVDAPLVAEAAENDDPAKSQKVAPPVEVFGQFFPHNDRDWVTFDAKKGESFWVDVVSNRLVGVTDPVVVVQRVSKDDKGNEVVTDVREGLEPENVPGMPAEFNAAHRDPAFNFAAPEDGTYRVLVRDAFNTNDDDPRRTYRLGIAPSNARADFRLIAWPQAPQAVKPAVPFVAGAILTQIWGTNLRPGGTMPVKVLAVRSGSFGGEITVTAEDLPPGVSCEPVTIYPYTNIVTLLLTADENAPASIGPIRIVGTATTAASPQPVSRSARSGAVVWGVTDPDNQLLRSRVAQQFVLAVTNGEPDPISVRPAEDKVWENSVAGIVQVPLKLTRRLNYNGVVKLKPAGSVNTILDMPEIEVPANATDGTLVMDFTARGLPVGEYTAYLQATSTAPYDRFPAQRAAAEAQKAAADKATPDLAAAVQKATEAVNAAKAEKVPEKIAAAEKALAEAGEKVKQNEAAKAALVEQVKNLSPKDTLAYGYSTPIQFKVTPAPITLNIPTPTTPLKPGGKLEIPVTLNRLYEFKGDVEFTVSLPQGVAGVSAPKLTVSPDKTQGTLTLEAAADAKAGDYSITLTASLKQNDRPVTLAQTIPVKVVTN